MTTWTCEEIVMKPTTRNSHLKIVTTGRGKFTPGKLVLHSHLAVISSREL